MASSPSCHARKCSLTRSCCNGFRYYGLKRECQANPDTLTVYIDEIDLDRLVDGGKKHEVRKDTAAINTFIQTGKNILFFRGQLWKASRLHCCHPDKGDFSAKMIPVARREKKTQIKTGPSPTEDMPRDSLCSLALWMCQQANADEKLKGNKTLKVRGAKHHWTSACAT